MLNDFHDSECVVQMTLNHAQPCRGTVIAVCMSAEAQPMSCCLWQCDILYLVCAATLMVVCLLQMDGVPGQLPGRRIDDYLSTLSEESTLCNNQPNGSAQANSNMRLEDISLI